MTAKGIEADIEARIRAALVAEALCAETVDQDGNAKETAFRSWSVDDEPAEDFEETEYPAIGIIWEPAQSADGGAGVFNDVPVIVRVMTHHSQDPKKAELNRLYSDVRYVLQQPLTGFTAVSYAKLILDGGDSGVENNEQFIEIQATATACGTAA